MHLAEIVKRGEEIYQRDLRAKLEKTCHGKHIIINVETGEYLVADTELEALKKFSDRFHETPSYLVTIGDPVRA